jgi:hypothetical protein
MNRWKYLAAVLVSLSCPAHTHVNAEEFVDLGGAALKIEQSVGSGSQSSYFVVDLGNNGGASYAFEYRFEPAASVTGFDAWSQIVQESDLDWDATVFDFGTFVDRFAYGSDGEQPVWADSAQSWAYWFGAWDSATSSIAWTPADVGMSDRIIQHGAFEGWRVTSYDPVTFDPLSAPVAPLSSVPEPSTAILLMTIGGAIVLRVARGERREARSVIHR